MIYVATPAWEGWDPYSLPGPDKDHAEGVGACLTRLLAGRYRVYVSWGPSAQHGQADAWRTRASVDWYVDLEGYDEAGKMREDWESGTAWHIERRFRTREQAEGAALWLRSCVEVAGEAGLRALNERTGGRLA